MLTVHIHVRSIKAIPPIVRKPNLCREDWVSIMCNSCKKMYQIAFKNIFWE